MNDYSIRPIMPERAPARAKQLISETLGRYNWIKHKVEKEEPRQHGINLLATVGGVKYDVYAFMALDGDIIEMDARSGGDIISILAPVEQVAFAVHVTKNAKDGVREIGFKPAQGYYASLGEEPAKK